jgi:hypothetical protein
MSERNADSSLLAWAALMPVTRASVPMDTVMANTVAKRRSERE